MSAYNLLGDKETCRDILQDVFADLWSKRKSTFIDALSGYLKVAVRNRVFRHLRNGAITRKHLDRLEKIAFVDATEQMVNFNLMKQKYEASVALLPEKCREVFLLSRVENLSIKEIAARLAISPKTVEAQISKALRHLRNTIGDSAVIVLVFLPLT